MTLIIPYTFVAGTKAQAAQVNEDFQAVATEVNSLGSDLSDAETAITNLSNNKADINGSSANRFAVANPVNSYDAVNKQTFASLCRYLIGGLKISRGGDDIISCTAGAGYDTTGAKIIVLASDSSKTNGSQAANTTYYVYLVGQTSGNGSDLLISTSSANPPMPAGYDLYLPIGYYTTDGNGKIKVVTGYSSLSSSDIITITETFVSGTSGYVIYSNGLIEQWGVNYYATPTISLIKPYSNTNYNIQASNTSPGDHYENGGIDAITVSSFRFNWGYTGCFWRTIGY